MLNPELFLAFLLITLVLVVTPGPIVTLVIATGATQGPRAALVTVAGTVSGNAILVTAIAFGLSWIKQRESTERGREHDLYSPAHGVADGPIATPSGILKGEIRVAQESNAVCHVAESHTAGGIY